MLEQPKLFIPTFCTQLAEIESQTREQLGGAADHFQTMLGDCLAINLAILSLYSLSEQLNLVYHACWGMLRELKWMHFHFLAGNYPWVKGRLRYLWEGTFRGYFVEKLAAPPVRARNVDEKLAWLENHKPRLDWNNCIVVTLRSVFPLASTEAKVAGHYHQLWQELNRYVHPSEYLLCRMVDDSCLHVKDAFDLAWAKDTIRASIDVVDLIWLAVLLFHDRAIEAIAAEKLEANYPIVDQLLAGPL